QRQSQLSKFALIGANDEVWKQQTLPLVQKEYRKDVIVDLRFDCCCNLLNELINLESRSHFETDFIQQREQLTVPALAFVHSRVFDSDCDLACEQIQPANLLIAKISDLRTFDVEDADDPVLADQRNSHFRSCGLDGFNVSGILAHIIDNDRSP